MSEETESKLVCLLIFRSAGVPVALWLLRVVNIAVRCTFPSAATLTLFPLRNMLFSPTNGHFPCRYNLQPTKCYFHLPQGVSPTFGSLEHNLQHMLKVITWLSDFWHQFYPFSGKVLVPNTRKSGIFRENLHFHIRVKVDFRKY